jgi:hypothetical protein
MNPIRSMLLIPALIGTVFLSSIGSAMANPNEPSIIIRHSEDKTFYEYKVNGELVEIKVVPKMGPAYYLVPTDDDDMKRQKQSNLSVPTWVIFSW